MREAAAERAAVAHLRIADRRGGLGDDRALLLQQRRRGDVVVHGAGADLDLAVRLADAGQSGMRAMSISTFGSLRRSFISGTRLWPPAMNLPSPSAACSFASASSSEVARA